jgi:hypothetical protein
VWPRMSRSSISASVILMDLLPADAEADHDLAEVILTEEVAVGSVAFPRSIGGPPTATRRVSSMVGLLGL